MNKFIFLFLLLPALVKGQTYKQLTDSAFNMMQSVKDSSGKTSVYPKAYAVIQEAFKRYPKETAVWDLYTAGILASGLGNKKEAFNYLDQMLSKNEWDGVLGKDTLSDFKALINEEEWRIMVKKAKFIRKNFLHQLAEKQKYFEAQGMSMKLRTGSLNAKQTYRSIKGYHQFPVIKDHFIAMQFTLNDTLQSPYLVCLPQNYDPSKSYPLLFFLHGAVINTTELPDYLDSTVTGGWNRFYTEFAKKQEVIMVYPSGNKQFNWMTPDDGFFMVPSILRQIKQFIHIDDNRVYITGHSNGATGSFSYLMKQPSAFAAFYGFNTLPRVATGGTYLRNILNRSYFNISTDEDYYYPPDANDSLTVVMKRLGADYKDQRYNGFPHWFPAFDESREAHELLFKDLSKRMRNAFRSQIIWECDDVKYGRCDWLNIAVLDTGRARASWQKDINFDIKKWKFFNAKDSLITVDTLQKAFKYAKKSGAAKAVYADNVFQIWTSAVRTVSIFISPEMVDLSKPVIIKVNGILKFKGMVRYNKEILIKEFENTGDRTALWVNRVDISVKL